MILLNSAGDLSGYTLIMPAESVGNVGQLTVDLIIASLECSEIGNIWHPAILPAVGGDPFQNFSEALTAGCCLFKNDAQKLLLVQFRAPVLSRRCDELLEKLLLWFKTLSLAKVIILTGSTFTGGCDSLIVGEKLRYVLTTNLLNTEKPVLEKMNWLEAPLESGKLFMPSSGYSKSLFTMLEEAGIPAAIIVKYCSEGDNIPDAIELGNYFNQWMNIVATTGLWKQPLSWRHMYGNVSNMIRIF